MKKLIIAYLFTITNVFAAPPTYFNGELQTNTYIQNIKAPNYQTTPLGGIDRRLETGNLNELQNANFEHTTVTTGWTVSNATVSGNTANPLEGKKSISLALTGALSLSQSSMINAAQKSGVQMVASVWVNSTDVSDLQLCSLKNGSEDKCTVTGGYVQGSGWRQLTISFIGNATSNGLKLKSTDTTGTVLVDSAFVGVGSPIVDFITTTDWEEFTPTFTGIGTPSSVKAFWKRTGDTLEVYGRATSGTVAASGFTINFSSLGVLIDTSKVVSDATKGQIAGTFARDSADGVMFNIGFNSTSTNWVYVADGGALGGLRDSDASAIINSSEKFTFKFSVPIAGWGGKSSKAYVASGSLALNTTEYSAKISGTTASDLNVAGWITSVAQSGTNNQIKTLTIPSGIFSVVPNCQCTINEATTATDISCKMNVGASTATSLVFHTSNNGSAAAQNPIITCQKQGADYQAAFNPVIVGSFQGYNETPGISAPKLFSFRVTTTSGTVANSRGGYVTSCTAANPTVCTLTGLTSAPTCSTTITGASSGGSNAVQNALATSTSLNIYTYITSTGLASASQPVEVICHGN